MRYNRTMKRGDSMISDDELAEVKQKFREQSQTRAGAANEIVKILNRFVQSYDNATNDMKRAKDEMNRSYVQNSALYEQRNMEIFNTYNERVSAIRSTAMADVREAVQTIKSRIAEVIGQPIPDNAMNDIQLLQNFSGKLSDSEISVYLDKYKKCYLVTKVIFSAMTDEQAERLHISFTNADKIVSALIDLEAVSTDIIRTYKGGNISYQCMLVLNGDSAQEIDRAFEKFVSDYS